MKHPITAIATAILLAVLAVLAAVAAWAIYNTASAPPERSDAQTPNLNTPPDTSAPTAPDVERGEITILDDNGNLQALVTFDEITPIDSQRSRVIKPVARFFAETTVAVVRADEGEFLWPARDQRPESGRLEGNTTIELHEHTPASQQTDPAIAPDQTHASPIATLATNSLRFQTLLGQIATPDDFTLTTPSLNLQGTGLELRVSEARQELQYLRINENLQATHTPNTEPAAEKTQTNQSDTNNNTQNPSTANTDTPTERLYRLRINNQVNIASQGRTLSADQAELFARTLENQLPADAITTLTPNPTPTPNPTTPTTGEPAPPQSTTASPATATPPQPIRLTAAGPVVLDLLPAPAPEPLEADHLALTLRSPNTGTVAISDPDAGLNASAGRISYGFTTTNLTIRGVGGELGIAINAATAPNQTLRFLGGAANINLQQGIAEIPGAGTVAIEPTNQAETNGHPASIRWTERADARFKLTPNPTTNTPRADLIQIAARGTVTARHEHPTTPATFTADAARADFRAPAPNEPTALHAVTLNGDARASLARDARRGPAPPARAAANSLRATFLPSTNTNTPRLATATATGTPDNPATASDAGDTIAATNIDLTFDTAARDTELLTATAQGAVNATTRRGHTLTAHRATYNATEDTLTAQADPDNPAQQTPARLALIDTAASGQHALAVSGPSLRLARQPARLEVFGSGAVELATRNTNAPPATPPEDTIDRLKLNFANALLIEDAAGTAEALGSVRANATRPATRETINAEADRLEIEFTPGLISRQSTPPATEDIQAIRLLSDNQGSNASLAATRNAQTNTTSARQRTELSLQLTAPTILASGADATLEAPLPGELAIIDLRQQPETTAEDDNDQPRTVTPTTRGATLITWQGALRLDATVNAARLTRAVKLRHLHPEADTLTFLECEQLTLFTAPANTRPHENATTANALDALTGPLNLERIQAEGAVYAQQGPVELVADSATYTQSTGLLQATAAPGNTVSLFDTQNARAIAADAITLNLPNGTWSATGTRATTTAN